MVFFVVSLVILGGIAGSCSGFFKISLVLGGFWVALIVGLQVRRCRLQPQLRQPKWPLRQSILAMA